MTTRTAAKAQSTGATVYQPKGLRVGLVAVTSVFSPGGGQSISASDVIQMVKVPAGATPVFIGLQSNYVQAMVSVGDGLDDDKYILAGSTSAAHAVSTFQAVIVGVVAAAPYTYSVDDTIDIAVSLVSVSTIAGGFTLTCIYSMDP